MNFTAIEDAIHSWITATSGLAADSIIHEKQGIQRPEPPYIGIRMSLRKSGQDWIDIEDKPLVLPSDIIDAVLFASDQLTLASHLFVSGDGPFRLTTTGALPAGLLTVTDYWIIVIDANTIQLADKFIDSVNTPLPISFSDAGSGMHTISGASNTERAGEEISHTLRGFRVLDIDLQCYGGDASGNTRPVSILNDVITKAILPSVADPLDVAGIALASFSPISNFDITLGPNIDIRGAVTVVAHLVEEITEDGTYIETAKAVNDPPFQ